MQHLSSELRNLSTETMESEIDLSQELPLLYGELVSGTPRHTQERTWMLRLLCAGLQVRCLNPKP